jgi:hypothetical protein
MAFIQTSDQSGAGIAAAAGFLGGGADARGVAWGGRGGRVEGSLNPGHICPLIKERGGRAAMAGSLLLYFPLHIQVFYYRKTYALISN